GGRGDWGWGPLLPFLPKPPVPQLPQSPSRVLDRHCGAVALEHLAANPQRPATGGTKAAAPGAARGGNMNRDEIHGKARDIKGRIKEAAGTLTGNENLESEGADERASGDSLESAGRARRKVGEALEELGEKIRK